MASEEPKVDKIQAEMVKKAAATAIDEVINKSMADRLLGVRPEDLIAPNPQAEVVKGTARRSSAWLHSPAHLELLAIADKRLTRIAAQRGIIVNEVERVHATLIRGTRLVVIQPAGVNDLSALPVNRYEGTSSAWINLFTLLAPENLTVETGYKERFEVAYVPKGSPLWPGLVFDLGRPTGRRKTTRKKNQTQQTGQPHQTEEAVETEQADSAE